MSWSNADLWDTQIARDVAKDIAGLGVYCGPAAVAWIAAVWNFSKGKGYDYKTRLLDTSLFPDGPRRFFGNAPGFEASLNVLLKRETDNELCLDDTIYYKYGTIHDVLEDYDKPIIICMKGQEFTDGLHYVSLYKSEKKNKKFAMDKIQFYWQDNGHYAGDSGLYKTGWRNVGQSVFTWGAHQVIKFD